MNVLHTQAGDDWRRRLRRPDGSLSPRVRSEEEERRYWREHIAGMVPAPDAYAAAVYERLEALALEQDVQSVLEIGPGWGNYTFSLCRRFRQVTCLDISPDNLAALAHHAEAKGLQLTTVCAPWEQAEVPRHDMVFAYNCFYRMEEPELFFTKIHRAARKLCVIGMGCPPEHPWLPQLEAAGLSIHYTRQGCREMREVLSSLGIQARLINIPNVRIYRHRDEEALLRRAESFLMEPCPREELLALLRNHYHTEADGSLTCRYPFLSQLLVWEPQ